MATTTAQDVYEQHVKLLSPAERLRLAVLMMQELAQAVDAGDIKPQRSIMELHGLGAEIWEGIDAQEYVNQLRSACNKQF